MTDLKGTEEMRQSLKGLFPVCLGDFFERTYLILRLCARQARHWPMVAHVNQETVSGEGHTESGQITI